MKMSVLLLLLSLGGFCLAESPKPTPLPPPVSIKEAIRLAEDYVVEKRIDVSQHYLASARIQSDSAGKLYWDAQWMHTDKGLKGGWFIIRVQMDKTTTLIPGK
jgi:hypothetical protein